MKNLIHKQILVSILLAFLAVSQVPITTGTSEEYLVSSVNIYLLAVSNGNRGVVVNVTLQAYYPGSGKVDIEEENGIIEADTLSSIYYSLRIASLVTGIDYRSFNYRIIFPEKIDLRGTSATLAFTLGFIGLLRRIDYSPKIGLTGIIAPNLIIGNVSGIDAKYYAALRYGLNYVIGPPQLFMFGKKSYVSAIDVFNAYKYYYGDYILPEMQVVGKPFIMVLSNAFNHSYTVLKRKMDLYTEKLGIDIHNLNGSIYYSLANKYYSTGDYYTAASYMFRAYINIYTNIFIKEAMRNPQIMDLLIEWLQRNFTKIFSLINTYEDRLLSRGCNLWNFDVLLNSYIRYSQAKLYYYLGNKSEDLNRKIEFYTASLARLQTVEHWLKLFINKTDQRFIDNIIKNYDVITDYINMSLIYLKSMKYISNSTMKSFEEIINANRTIPWKMLHLGHFFYMLNFNLSLIRGLFDLFISPKTVADLNKTVNGLGYLIASKAGYLPPTMLTTAELIKNYLIEGEKTYNLGSLEYLSLAILVYELMITQQYISLSIQKTIYTYSISHYNIRQDIIPAIVALIIGSFLSGYLYGKIRAKTATSENQVLSYTYSHASHEYFQQAVLEQENLSPDQGEVSGNKERRQDDT